jgi:hypothetical protein
VRLATELGRPPAARMSCSSEVADAHVNRLVAKATRKAAFMLSSLNLGRSGLRTP